MDGKRYSAALRELGAEGDEVEASSPQEVAAPLIRSVSLLCDEGTKLSFTEFRQILLSIRQSDTISSSKLSRNLSCSTSARIIPFIDKKETQWILRIIDQNIDSPGSLLLSRALLQSAIQEVVDSARISDNIVLPDDGTRDDYNIDFTQFESIVSELIDKVLVL